MRTRRRKGGGAELRRWIEAAAAGNYWKMDDDDFGGFEAAETFEGGNGEPQATSPAIPWAAFPTEVLREQTAAPTSASFVPASPLTSSGDIVTDNQLSSDALNLPDLKEQATLLIGSSLEVPVSTLSLPEDLETAHDGDDNDETLELKKSKNHLQKTLASLEVKLKVADEEKCKVKKELEDLLEKYRILETDFLKDKEDKLISHQDRYTKLQEKHKHELEDMRRTGHEALAIIVEEFKALLQSTVQQREEAVEKQYVSAIEKQAHKCEELLNAQHQRLLDILNKEREALKEKIEESLMQQSQEYKEILEKCMADERQRNSEALAATAKIEKEDVQAAVLIAVKEERENLEKLHAEEKERWQIERSKDRETIAQAVEDSMQEHRQSSQETIKAAIMEEQKKSEKAVEEAVRQAREELMEYIKEQKRLDQVIRQRSLSSLELFLSCAQKQLNTLLQEEPPATTAEQTALPP
ncbi:coiled-coil domain-containing protein 91 [Heteronotia binoei]|uniref:coiled-coil domain-containing protein 91 n=1 Tax=Heteronotia binoei TaxID=13085 RepID=UPI002931A0C2|nr:coiled-coil domain-containing protein 91 [Heteronotia binoei]